MAEKLDRIFTASISITTRTHSQEEEGRLGTLNLSTKSNNIKSMKACKDMSYLSTMVECRVTISMESFFPTAARA